MSKLIEAIEANDFIKVKNVFYEKMELFVAEAVEARKKSLAASVFVEGEEPNEDDEDDENEDDEDEE